MKRPILSFFLFSTLALLLPASVTVRDCDGNRYRTHPRWPLVCNTAITKHIRTGLQPVGVGTLPVILFFHLPAEMDSGHKGRPENQARQGHY